MKSKYVFHRLETNGPVRISSEFVLAEKLLMTYGLVAGFRGAEDASGRRGVDLLPVPETVTRCFELAELFVAEAEARGFLEHSSETMEDITIAKAKLEALAMNTKYEEDDAAREARRKLKEKQFA